MAERRRTGGRAPKGPGAADPPAPLRTPDGRYLVVRGRLWRATNPHLTSAEREAHVQALMTARREIAAARRRSDPARLAAARAAVHAAKVALGERGPVWWTDGAPDYDRHLVRNTPYREWHETATSSDPDT